jgi:F420-non-reducing hydrogenase small subunit
LKLKIATIGLTGCSGCHVALVSLHEKLLELLENAEIVHSYILVDTKHIPEDVDLGIVEGSIRTSHNEEIVKELREKAKTLIALGSCSCFGGVQGLGNIHSREELLSTVYEKTATVVEGLIPTKDLPQVLPQVKPINAVVKVDYMIPGCPPEVETIAEVLSAVVKGEKPKLSGKNVCDECPRERKGIKPKEFKRIYEGEPDPNQCLLEQGYLCLGPATRSGCGAKCPKANMPCEGCYGPCEEALDQGLAMLDALTATAGKILPSYSLDVYPSYFSRYTFASSILLKVKRR